MVTIKILTITIDDRRDLACSNATRDVVQAVTIRESPLLMSDGHGDSNSRVFADATSAAFRRRRLEIRQQEVFGSR